MMLFSAAYRFLTDIIISTNNWYLPSKIYPALTQAFSTVFELDCEIT